MSAIEERKGKAKLSCVRAIRETVAASTHDMTTGGTHATRAGTKITEDTKRLVWKIGHTQLRLTN